MKLEQESRDFKEIKEVLSERKEELRKAIMQKQEELL
jgi:hypothetical protein